MSEFHKEKEHDGFAILYDSHDIENKFKRSVNYKYVIIKDKEEKRISAIVTSAGEIGGNFIHLQTSAISCIAIAKSEEEAVLKQLGFISIEPSGVIICPECLNKAILACEENLEVLKDLKEAIKDHAIKF